MDVLVNTVNTAVSAHANLLVSQGSVALNLLACLGYDPLNPPIANLLSQQHQLDGSWVLLSPVHWQATHNNAMIVASGSDLELNEEQSKSYFNLLADYLAEEGGQLFYSDANTWLLNAADKPALNAKPINYVLNHPLMPELAELDPTMYWQTFFTECQMFFASRAENAVVNGVWAWGGAKLSSKSNKKICADKHLYTMADCCSTEVTLYSPNIKLKEFELLLISDVAVLSTVHQSEMNTRSARWYWNNTAYSLAQGTWFTRIWRSFTHAH